MGKPIVAIVGRPNVGKSMLFNKLTGRRMAIVEDTPGVTRDRIYGECDWNGRAFRLVDTGGIEPGTDSDMLKFMRRQAEIAIETADVIIMVTDVTVGLTAADSEVATMLKRRRSRWWWPSTSATASARRTRSFTPSTAWAWGTPLRSRPSTATAPATCWTPAWSSSPPRRTTRPKTTASRWPSSASPNVGKSSLLNQILGQERVIVSDVAGTTRDAIDSDFENEFGKYCFIDTAGMRRKSKVDDAIEKYSNLRTVSAIERADVCLILIDAVEGVTEQDTKIAGLAHEAGKASILVVNKWDLIDKETNTMDKMTDEVRRDLSYMTYAPVLFLSALTGQRVNKLYQLINEVVAQSAMRISTGMLNNVLEDSTARVQPPATRAAG